MLLLALVATLGLAQAAPQDPMIRSTTRLVEINVVAQDKFGRYLDDLRQEEFEILDNGRLQPVTLFAANVAPPVVRTSVAGGTPKPSVASSGYAVILLDWLNTPFGDLARSREQVLQMLRQIDSSDRIALYVLDRGLRVVHEFGGDREALLKRIAGSRGSPDSVASPSSPYDASRREIALDLFGPPPPPSMARGGSRIAVEEQVTRLDTRIRDTLAALEAIGKHLTGLKGRKSVIWVSAGIPTSIDGSVIPGANAHERTYSDEIDRAIRRLNDADVAVYAIDARGLSISSKAYINIQTMELFASRTGGVAYANRNDIDNALRSALDDQRVSYTLGFYIPENASGEAPHHLRIRVARPGIQLRYRQSYSVK